MIKICLMILLNIFLCLLYIYPRKRFHILSKQRAHKLKWTKMYVLTNKWSKKYNLFLLFMGPLLFIVAIFSLRILNKDRTINLDEFYTKFKALLCNTPIWDGMINIIILVLFILVYTSLMSKYMEYIKYHAIKRHIYLCNPNTEEGMFYINKICHELFYKIMVSNLAEILGNIISLGYKHTLFSLLDKKYPEDYESMTFWNKQNVKTQFPVDPDCLTTKYYNIIRIIKFILTKGHYFLVIILILHDIIFNDFVIKNIFPVLPFIFLYELYLRFSLFVDNFHLPYDETFHILIYAHIVESYDEKTMIIGGEFYDKVHLSKIYHTYIKRNFVKDRNDLS